MHLTTVPTRAPLDDRGRLLPFDAMDGPLQHAFLAVDRLRRVDPPGPGGPATDSWLPRPHDSVSGTTHHTTEEPA